MQISMHFSAMIWNYRWKENVSILCVFDSTRLWRFQVNYGVYYPIYFPLRYQALYWFLKEMTLNSSCYRGERTFSIELWVWDWSLSGFWLRNLGWCLKNLCRRETFKIRIFLVCEIYWHNRQIQSIIQLENVWPTHTHVEFKLVFVY